MQTLEQQVGELRIDAADDCCDRAQGETGNSQPSSGTYFCKAVKSKCKHTI